MCSLNHSADIAQPLTRKSKAGTSTVYSSLSNAFSDFFDYYQTELGLMDATPLFQQTSVHNDTTMMMEWLSMVLIMQTIPMVLRG